MPLTLKYSRTFTTPRLLSHFSTSTSKETLNGAILSIDYQIVFICYIKFSIEYSNIGIWFWIETIFVFSFEFFQILENLIEIHHDSLSKLKRKKIFYDSKMYENLWVIIIWCENKEENTIVFTENQNKNIFLFLNNCENSRESPRKFEKVNRRESPRIRETSRDSTKVRKERAWRNERMNIIIVKWIQSNEYKYKCI